MSFRGFSLFTDEKVNTLQGQVNTGFLDASNARGDIITDLSNEIVRATSAEGVLRSDLSGEIIRATDAEGVLRSDLSAVSSRVQNLEQWRTDNTDEINLQVDKAINEKVNQTAYDTVVSQLQSKDSDLTQALSQAIVDREKNDELHNIRLNDLFEYLNLHSKTYVIEDRILLDDERVAGITADGKAPEASVAGGWYYKKVAGETPNKINWYFYGDVDQSGNPAQKVEFQSVENFYIRVNVPSGADTTWITAYTHPEKDGADGATWYRSRHNFSGFYEEAGSPNFPRDVDVLMYFGSKSPKQVFSHLQSDSAIELDLASKESTEHQGLREGDELMKLIALSSDSSSSTTEVRVMEVGYKFANRLPRILSLVGETSTPSLAV